MNIQHASAEHRSFFSQREPEQQPQLILRTSHRATFLNVNQSCEQNGPFIRNSLPSTQQAPPESGMLDWGALCGATPRSLVQSPQWSQIEIQIFG